MHMVTFQKKIIENMLSTKNKKWHAYFLLRLGELLQAGFSLKEGIQFLIHLMPKEKAALDSMLTALQQSDSFFQVLQRQQFSERVCTQVLLSESHGHFEEVLIHSGHYLLDREKQQKKLKKLLQYPAMLGIFMLGLLLAMRSFLLPHFLTMLEGNQAELPVISAIAMKGIEAFPFILLLITIIVFTMWLAYKVFISNKSAMMQATFVCRLPLIGQFRNYLYTHYFAHELGHLYKSGHELYQILRIMQQQTIYPLMKEVAQKIEQGLSEGISVHTSIQKMPFFRVELAHILMHGDRTNNLASELFFYAQNCQMQLTNKVEKAMSYIQPLVFMLIAVLILSIYLAILLPIFSMMEGIS